MYDIIKRLAKKNVIFERIIYLAFLIHGFFYNLLCRLLCLLPIQENKIVCCNAKGRHYADNPKYITEALLRRGGDYDIVWLLLKENDTELPRGVRRVTYGSFAGLKELMTAAVWVDSHQKEYGVYKRKKQFFFETWHGSYGLKKVGTDINNFSLIDRRLVSHSFRLTDLMLSNSRKTTETYRRAFHYRGQMQEYGSPRNDIFFRDPRDFIRKVNEYFRLKGKRVAMYAPTFRSDYNTEFIHSIDFNIICNSLARRFGGEWVMLMRLHPFNTREAKKSISHDELILNAIDYDDMQELLVACDVLITDYSSCMFDFATGGKFCFLYAPDIEEYRNDRGYDLDIYDLPFPLGRNTAELEQKILEFDEDIYQEKLKELHEQVGLNETGHASEYAAQSIEEWLKE